MLTARRSSVQLLEFGTPGSFFREASDRIFERKIHLQLVLDREQHLLLQGSSATIPHEALSHGTVVQGGRVSEGLTPVRPRGECSRVGEPVIRLMAGSAGHGTVYRQDGIEEEPTRGRMKLSLISERVGENATAPFGLGKFGFFSDESATHSAAFSGSAASESGGWQAGFCFYSRDETTATAPGFDADGNANNTINTGHAASGVGSTGIEIPFGFY